MQMTPIVLYAVVRLLLSLFFLILQLAILPLFCIYTEYRHNSCYRIMLAIGVVDILQLLVNGLFIFFGLIDFDYSVNFEKWAGAINAGTWDILFVLQLLLALNRLSVILKNIFLISIKGRELPWERRLFNLLLLLSTLLCLAIMALFASPYCGLYFHNEEFYWGYGSKYRWTMAVRDAEFKATGFLPLATFAAYVLIVCLHKWKRAPQSMGLGGEQRRLLNMQERRILLQSGSQFLLLSLLMLCTYFLPPDASLDMVAMLNVGSIVVCGINPLLYLTMNSQFRQRFLQMFRCRGEHSERMFVIQTAIQTRRESRVRPASFLQQLNANRPKTMPPIQ